MFAQRSASTSAVFLRFSLLAKVIEHFNYLWKLPCNIFRLLKFPSNSPSQTNTATYLISKLFVINTFLYSNRRKFLCFVCMSIITRPVQIIFKALCCSMHSGVNLHVKLGNTLVYRCVYVPITQIVITSI